MAIVENVKKSIINNKKIYFFLLLYSFLTFPILILSMIYISLPSPGGVIGIWGVVLFLGTIVALLMSGITLGVKMFRITQMFLFPNIFLFVCTFISVLLTHIILLGSYKMSEVFAIAIALCALPIISSLICLISKISKKRKTNKNSELE